MTIEQNVKIRRIAQEALSFALELIQEEGLDPDQREQCILHLHEQTQFPESKPSHPVWGGRDQPMTDQEARDFEDSVVPFSPHRGRRVADVPIDFLQWLDDQPDFRRELRRYCKSERWRLVQEAEEMQQEVSHA